VAARGGARVDRSVTSDREATHDSTDDTEPDLRRATAEGDDRRREARRTTDRALADEVASVVHDLNNMFGAIRTNIDLLRHYTGSDERVSSRLQAIEVALVCAEEISDQLPAALDEGAPGPAAPGTAGNDVNDVVGAIGSMLGTATPEGVELRTQLEADRSSVRAPRVAIERILVNLVTNAVRAVGEAGAVTVVTHNELLVDEGPSSDGNRPAPGTYVVISVLDTGPGFDQDVLEHAAGTPSSIGTVGPRHGMGLHVCHVVARSNGGWVDADRRPEGGMAVRVHLPVAQERPRVPRRRRANVIQPR
jgi:signal transduction histidine kinase